MASKGVELSRVLGQSSLAEKSVLGSLFPSSSGESVSQKREAHFIHWLTEALSQQKKKKAANKLNVRPFEQVVLLHQYRGEQFLGIKYTKRCNVKSISSH